MAATLTAERFYDPLWSYERKLDGIRLLAYKDGSEVRLLSRNRLLRNADYGAVERAVAALAPGRLILDGEATWDPAQRVAYHVFDIMWFEQAAVTGLSLPQRRDYLDRLPLQPPLGRVAELSSREPWLEASRQGWEGVVAKRRDSVYEHRRSPHWLKMKCESAQEFVVGGYTEPQRGRVGLGALLVGYYEGSELVYAGKVGTGFDNALLLELRARFEALEIATTPFTRAVGLPRLRAHWVRPEVVVQVAFLEWTVHGKLRHSRFLRLRQDKAARQVVKEG